MQYAHHANVSKMTFKCHCQLNLSVMTKCFCFWLKTNRLYCFLKVILKLFHHCQPSVDHFIQLRFATHERSNSTRFLTAIWVQLYSQKQTHSKPALISKLLELPCNIIILQIYNSIGINKTDTKRFYLHSCCTTGSQRSSETSIVCDIVCYTWLYIFCITLHYLHQPFIIHPVIVRKVHSLREALN